MSDSQEVNFPEDPYSVITLRWKPGGPVIVDTRGVEIGMAYLILQKAAESVINDFEDPIVFYEDEDVVSDEELEHSFLTDEDDD